MSNLFDATSLLLSIDLSQETPIFLLIEKLSLFFSSFYEEMYAYQCAWWVMENITQQGKTYLICQNYIRLTSEQLKKLYEILYEIKENKKPIAYILGSVPFAELTLLVEPPILIPRLETEEWILELIAHLKPHISTKSSFKILDLCTGSGALALALAHTFPSAQIIASDISERAIKLAKKNATYNDINNVQFVVSDLFELLHLYGPFDLIVSNPPYIALEEWNHLEESVKHWEDKNALVAAGEGLALIEKIIKQAPEYLAPSDELSLIPQLVIEIGYAQGKEMAELLKKLNYTNILLKKDLAGQDRVVYATLK